jgi:predicted dehydrogenase
LTTIKFAICGVGHIGKRHCAVVQGFHNSELSSVIDIDPLQLGSIEVPPSVNKWSSLEDFLNHDNNQTDVVSICTPNGSHIDLAQLAIEKGYHVVIEKPIGISSNKISALIELASQKQRNIFVVKQNRYSPPIKWLKEVVETGKLGNIFMVQINCYWNRDDRYYTRNGWRGSTESDGGVLFTQFSHFIDIMHWIFGDICSIKTHLENYTHQESTEFPDSGVSQFRFENGALGSVSFSTSVFDKNFESSISVIGEKGTVKIGGQYMDLIEYCHIDGYEQPNLPPTNPPNDYGPFKGSAANHHYVIENVVNTLNGNDTITANALEGLKVVDIIERIYQAAE